MPSKHLSAGLLVVSLSLQTSHAATIAYYDEAGFQSALDTFTLVNLDAPPFDGFGTAYNVQDPGPQAAFLDVGISGFDANHQVVTGNDIQIVKEGRDRLLTNGSGFGVGDMVFHFEDPVNGIGAWPNLHPAFGADGGEIIAYDINGAEIDRVAFGQSPATPGGFSGLISDVPIKTVEITCTFNSDLKCGVYDIQFGNLNPVPVPAAAPLFLSALVLIGFLGRHKSGRSETARIS
jgi:hypothetical protein